MTVRSQPDLYRYIYDNRGDHQYYANPADEFRGFDERPRSDPRDNDPYWGVDHDRDRDNDYEGQQSVGYQEVTVRRLAMFAIAPMNRRRKKSRDLSWYFE